MANSKITTYGNRSTAASSLLWSLLIIGAFCWALVACAVPGDPADPCAPGGCRVPVAGEPLYVPLCATVGEWGPCVGQMGGTWLYMDQGQPYPRGRALVACATEDGGTDPCVWVPSAMGNGTGDLGAYVYGVTGHGFPLPSEVEPS